MAKLDPRKLMEQAIEVMRQSVSEPRADGKANPLVGAVLWKSDGTVETACRGELRDGDHAEYALLERKNRDKKLDGAVLFATLEPCAPGSRRHPKLSCAERIVLARIKKVWIGIEDPDPKVDRKGIKYLQDSDVTVRMRGLGVEVSEGMSKAERVGWEWLATKQTVSSVEYAAAMRLPNRTALNHLKHFAELRLVRKLGSGPATRYEVTGP